MKYITEYNFKTKYLTYSKICTEKNLLFAFLRNICFYPLYLIPEVIST